MWLQYFIHAGVSHCDSIYFCNKVSVHLDSYVNSQIIAFGVQKTSMNLWNVVYVREKNIWCGIQGKKLLDHSFLKQQLTLLAIKKLFKGLSQIWICKIDFIGFNRKAQLRILPLVLCTFWGSSSICKSFQKTYGLLTALIYHHVISSCEAMWKTKFSPVIQCWRTKGQNHGSHSLHWSSDSLKSISEPAVASSGVSRSKRRAFRTSLVTFYSIVTS